MMSSPNAISIASFIILYHVTLASSSENASENGVKTQVVNSKID